MKSYEIKYLKLQMSDDPHNRLRDKNKVEEEDDEEDDHVIKLLKKQGCLKEHYDTQDCMAETKDWRQCQPQVKAFRACIAKSSQNKST